MPGAQAEDEYSRHPSRPIRVMVERSRTPQTLSTMSSSVEIPTNLTHCARQLAHAYTAAETRSTPHDSKVRAAIPKLIVMPMPEVTDTARVCASMSSISSEVCGLEA